MKTHRNPIGQLGNTRRWPFRLRSLGRQFRDAPSDWRRSSFAFPGSRLFHILLALEDQIDVGLSARLEGGLGFFDPLHAVSSGLPCGWLALEQPRRDDTQRLFHVPSLSQDGLGPLCTPAVPHWRRATLESPNLTAYLLVQALISLVWIVLVDDACECLIV